MVLRRDRLWLALLALGALCTALFALDVAADLASAVIGVVCILAWAFGPRLHAVHPRRPWRLMTAAASFFLVGIIVRAMLVDQPAPVAQIGDAFTICGFGFFIASLVTFQSRWGMDRHALVDGLIVCIGSALASTLLFVLPAASIPGRPLIVTLIAGLYPLLDTVTVLLVANLAFTTAKRQPSFMLMGAMMVLVFAGDLGYAIIGRHGDVIGPRLMALPFLLAFTLGGAAALHPTAKALARAIPLPIQAWSVPRMLLIGPAVAVPFVLTVTLSADTPVKRWALGLGGAAIVALLLVRASAAVQSHAAAQRRFEHQATHDPLTDLPNRRMLSIMVERLLGDERSHERGDRAANVWMFYLDLDGFKLVNDSWGHPAGDQLIVAVGTRLRQALPDTATIARVGGDEFVIVQRCTEPEAMANARRIMECVEHPWRSSPPRAAAPRWSSARRWASCRRPGTPAPTGPTRSCATPTPRCTGRRSPAATAGPSSTPRCATRCGSGSRSRWRCAPPSRRSSSASPTSRSSRWTPAGPPAPRRCAGGSTRSAAGSDPTCSSPSPRTPTSSPRSAPGCCASRCCSWPGGAPTAWSTTASGCR
ncbi:hypothetical protein GCM10027610_047070 [Dactylosporangium cerinum]